MRTKSDIPQLLRVRECIDEGRRISLWQDVSYPCAICHPVDNAWVIIFVIDDLRNKAASDKRAYMTLRGSCDEQMIIENPRLDPPGINTNVKNVFTDIQALVCQILGDKPRFLEYVGPRGQNEPGVRRFPHALDKPGKIGILVREGVSIERHPSEKIIETCFFESSMAAKPSSRLRIATSSQPSAI